MKNKTIDLMKLMLSDLRRSGLNRSDANKAHFKLLDAEQTVVWTGKKTASVPSYLIRYFLLDGTPKPDSEGRVRLLFDALPKNERVSLIDKLPKYLVPSRSVPDVYLCPLVDWHAVLADPTLPVWIVEGEKKAWACAVGRRNAVGISGVYMYGNKNSEIDLLPGLQQFIVKGRPIYISFDTDMYYNENVFFALTTLCNRLLRHGAVPRVVHIAHPEGERVSIDDNILKPAKRSEWPRLLDDLETNSEVLDETLAIDRLNKELAVVGRGRIWVFPENRFYSQISALKEIGYARQTITTLESNGKFKTKPAFDIWRKSPRRREYREITFVPGGPPEVDGALNLWLGWGVEPKPGNIDPFKRQFDYLFARYPEQQEFIWQFIAHTVQKPAIKLTQNLLLWSTEQRVGKTAFGQTLGRIHGKGFAEVTQSQLSSQFNPWALYKTLILGNEINGYTHHRDRADQLKSLITDETLWINQKNQPEICIPNCINMIFTSNHPNAQYLEQADRRTAVFGIAGSARPQSHYRQYFDWLNNKDGAAHLFHYLLNDVTLSGFDPKGHAPMTKAKEEMIEAGRSTLESQIALLRDAPSSYLPSTAKGRSAVEIFTLQQLVRIFETQMGHKNLSPDRLGTKLRMGGFPKANFMLQGNKYTFYAIVNPEVWARELGADSDVSQWRRHLEMNNPIFRRSKFSRAKRPS